MHKDYNIEPLIAKIRQFALQSGPNDEVSVVLASKGIDDDEAMGIEQRLQAVFTEEGLKISFQWLYSETTIRCGLCHSVFKLKKMNRQTVLCPVCEFKSVELLTEKSLSIFSVIG